MRCLSRTTMSIEKLYYHRAAASLARHTLATTLTPCKGLPREHGPGLNSGSDRVDKGPGTTQGKAGQAGLQTRQLYPSRSSVLVSHVTSSSSGTYLHRDHSLHTSCTPSIYYRLSPSTDCPPSSSPLTLLDSYLAPPYSFSSPPLQNAQRSTVSLSNSTPHTPYPHTSHLTTTSYSSHHLHPPSPFQRTDPTAPRSPLSPCFSPHRPLRRRRPPSSPLARRCSPPSPPSSRTGFTPPRSTPAGSTTRRCSS